MVVEVGEMGGLGAGMLEGVVEPTAETVARAGQAV